MNELSILENNPTMTSREIAELTGKRHCDVLRDIDSLLETLNADLRLGFKTSTYKDSSGKENRQFEMDRDSSYCVVAGYDANSRMRIIKRWQELEAANARPLSLAQLALVNAQALVALEEEQRQLALRQEATERRLDQIETATDHFTIIGWWRYAKQSGSLPIAEAAKRGRQATLYCNDHEVPMGEVPDPRFGSVKTYPKWVLDELFAGAH